MVKTKAYYRRLARAIADEETRPLRCYQVDDALESYVDAELSSEEHRSYVRACGRTCKSVPAAARRTS